MRGGKAYLNRHLKSMEKSIEDAHHFNNLQHMRPVTRNFPFGGDLVTLNKRKQQMFHEVRYNQIERENKILFDKIASTMKRNNPHGGKNNRSLNEINRRQRHQRIEVENAKLLERLQSRKPTYDGMQFRKQWEDNKSVIKRLANYNFHLTNINSNNKFNLTQNAFYTQSNFKPFAERTIKKTIHFDNVEMIITIKLSKQMLKIIGTEQNGKTLKIIQIPIKEAEQFIKQQCDGDMQNIFECLKYDPQIETLYLVSVHQSNPEQQTMQNPPSHSNDKGNKYNKLTKVKPSDEYEEQDQRQQQNQDLLADQQKLID